MDCPRRFQLRYLESQSWPGVHIEPVLEHEQHVYRGARFHRLIERHQLGIDVDLLSETVVDDLDLQVWWQAYLKFEFLHSLVGERYPELLLFTVVADVPLVAVFDLVVVVPDGRVFIFDWKTYVAVPSRQWFEARLQTRVYPYVLVTEGVRLLGYEVLPDKVSFVYWVVGSVDPMLFEYSSSLYVRDQEYLRGLVLNVLSRWEWPLAFDEGVCRFCVYRSLCGRGVVAGGFDELGNIYANIAELGGVSFVDEVSEVGF